MAIALYDVRKICVRACFLDGASLCFDVEGSAFHFALSIFYSKQRGPFDCMHLRDIRVVGRQSTQPELVYTPALAQLTSSGDIMRLVLISPIGGASFSQ